VARLGAGLLLVAMLCLQGCSSPAPPSPPAATQERLVDWYLANMTVAEKVGQLLWVGLPEGTAATETEALIRQGKVGGVIYFARQGSDPAALRSLSERLQAAARQRERPTPGLIIAVDHEGGLVQRWGPPFTTWPGNMAIGATGSTAYAEQVAAAMARELAAVGVNLNLSPVADVNVNPQNPVIGIRSYGEDPARVADLVAAAVRGSQSAGVSAAVKHFPGHGDTVADSHKGLPSVPHSRERLNRVELVPFRSAIAAGVDVIMTAHVAFPAVATDGLPATLSREAIQGLLKGEMGFQGVVVTDALDSMQAITGRWDLRQALVMAVQAGADAVLITDSFAEQAALHGHLVQAVQDGRIPRERLDDAVRRQLALKARQGLLPEPGGTGTPVRLPPLDQVGAAAHRRLALEVGAGALTLVRNQHLPLRLSPAERVLVVGPAYGPRVSGDPDVATPLGAGVKAQHANTREVLLEKKPGSGSIAAVKAMAAEAAVIVYGVYNARWYPEHQALIRALIAAGKPVVVVGLGEPYDLAVLPEVETYLAAYGYQEPNLQGVGAVLFGKAEARGCLPVRIPDLYPLGCGHRP
jgi:beta-N-acetylhexosaminidase